MRKIVLHYVFILCFVVLPASSAAQGKYHTADSIASAAKATGIEALHKELVRPLVTDEEKLRAFYFWIAQNISYDVNEWVNPSGNFSKQDPDNVFRNKKAVCHGYSDLFKTLCDLSQIKCFMVSGYTKKAGMFINEGHTWNVVFVNNTWLPVDATWGAGGVDERRKFVKSFDEKYFLANPVSFLTDHYPFDPAWQLVAYPVDLASYKKKDWKYAAPADEPPYNYNDTLANWIKQDSVAMRLQSAQRMVRMNANDAEAKRELSFAYMDFAQQESMKGSAILTELYPPSKNKQTTETRANLPSKEFNAKLDRAYQHFNTADSILSKTTVYSQSDRNYIDANRKVIKHNKDIIKNERR